MAEICQRVLDGFAVPVEWALSIAVQVFNGKGGIRNCSCYGVVKLLEHELKVVEMVIEKRFYRIMSDDEIKFYFRPERGTIDAVFILRRLQEEYHAKGNKLYVFCGPRKNFCLSTREIVGMGNKEGNTRSFNKISDESVGGSKDKSQSVF